jgi:hypothetical protein
MADADNAPREKASSRVLVAGHEVYRVTYRNTAAYFLRLPDGNPEGSGFRGTGHQSLALFASGRNAILSAIDRSTVYRGWTDLVATLRAILDLERGRAPFVHLNVSELDPTLNPGDHSDHLMTARAALDAAKQLACARRRHYVGYASTRLGENLDPEQRDIKNAVFAVTAAGVLAFDHGSTWDRRHRAGLGRTYVRLEEGTGRCGEHEADPARLHAVAERRDRR